jgi:uncharacterized OB-fold protein
MKCPTCGADNDPANRFCDQCGTRLDAPPAAQAAPTVSATATTVTATCPRCGASVLPGQAFCDECGASLDGVVAPVPASEAPTVFAAPAGVAASNGSAIGPVCPQCGTVNTPGDRFCDNCGAALTEPASAEAAPSPAASGAPTAQESAPASIDATSPAVDEATVPAGDDASAAPADVPLVNITEEAPVPATTSAPEAAPAETASAAGDAQAAYEAQRAQLEADVARQQQVVAQLESVQQTLGAATPAGVLQSLDDARAALGRTQAELDALQPPAPPVDPAELARLNDEITRQQQVVAQLESVQQTLGAATPAGVLQSLDDARAALARTQAELDALGGGAPATAAAPQPAPPAQQQPVGPTDQTVVASPAPTPAPAPEPEPAAPPAPAGARLVFEESGTEVVLPTDRSEIVIGREDPISGIHPEVDMTPFGGESGGVSRQHARLNLDNGQWTITDLNSTNYTRVDGAKLDANVPTALHDGARIQLGRVSVTFRL